MRTVKPTDSLMSHVTWACHVITRLKLGQVQVASWTSSNEPEQVIAVVCVTVKRNSSFIVWFVRG